MKLGKKIAATGMAVVLSAGFVSGGAVLDANAFKIPKATCNVELTTCESALFATTGGENIRVTVTNYSKTAAAFTIVEDVEGTFGAPIYWSWDKDKNLFNTGVGRAHTYSVPAEGTAQVVVTPTAFQGLDANKVNGIYVVANGNFDEPLTVAYPGLVDFKFEEEPIHIHVAK